MRVFNAGTIFVYLLLFLATGDTCLVMETFKESECKKGSRDVIESNTSYTSCLDECKARDSCTGVSYHRGTKLCLVHEEDAEIQNNDDCKGFVYSEKQNWKEKTFRCRSPRCDRTRADCSADGDICKYQGDCRLPTQSNGSLFLHGNLRNVGSKIAYGCRRNHILVRAMTLSCLPSKEWSQSYPSCNTDIPTLPQTTAAITVTTTTTPSSTIDTQVTTTTTSITETPTTTPTSSTTETPVTTTKPSVTENPTITPTSITTEKPVTTTTPSSTETPTTTPASSTSVTPTTTPISTTTVTPTTIATSSTTDTPTSTPISSTTVTPTTITTSSTTVTPPTTSISSTTVAPTTIATSSTTDTPTSTPISSTTVTPTTIATSSTTVTPTTTPISSTTVAPPTTLMSSTTVTPTTSPTSSTTVTPATTPISSTTETQVTTTTQSTTNQSCPDGWKKYDSSCYFITSRTQSVNYENAVKKCGEFNATLAVPNTQGENDYIKSILKAKLSLPTCYWIGIKLSYGAWTRSDGTPFDSLNNSDWAVEGECAVFEKATSYKWASLYCSRLCGVICEKAATNSHKSDSE